jgi:hypothetical protein
MAGLRGQRIVQAEAAGNQLIPTPSEHPTRKLYT